MTNQADKSASITREKHRFGTAYGALAGIALTVAMWGWDAILLGQVHAFFPWLKLVAGIILGLLIGGITGWLAARVENGLCSFFFWLGATVLFAWLTVGVPLQVMPMVVKFLRPDIGGFLQYEIGSGYLTRFGIALAWLLIFVTITGVLQLTLIDSAVFSTSLFGRFAPFVVCVFLLGLSGTILDDLVNAPFRQAIFAMDTPIQFILDHKGKPVDRAESRNAHAGSLHGVLDLVTEERKSIVSSYDDSFVQIQVLVRFEDDLVDCMTVFGQASFCKLAAPTH